MPDLRAYRAGRLVTIDAVKSGSRVYQLGRPLVGADGQRYFQLLACADLHPRGSGKSWFGHFPESALTLVQRRDGGIA